MADLTHDDVRKILTILDASNLDEVHIEIGDFKLDVRRRGGGSTDVANRARTSVAPPQPALAHEVTSAARLSQQSLSLSPGQFVVSAPMLGTFYRAPAPEARPFVEQGAQVAANEPLCIIEVMKLMNTIVAERAGCVVQILVDNATLVEFGQPLMIFDPV